MIPFHQTIHLLHTYLHTSNHNVVQVIEMFIFSFRKNFARSCGSLRRLKVFSKQRFVKKIVRLKIVRLKIVRLKFVRIIVFYVSLFCYNFRTTSFSKRSDFYFEIVFSQIFAFRIEKVVPFLSLCN